MAGVTTRGQGPERELGSEGELRREGGLGGGGELRREGGLGSEGELDGQIAQWRTYLERHRVVGTADVDELEDHLRDQVAELGRAGLRDDEAFLVAVKRMGSVDALSREFAREHSDRLWKQLVLRPEADVDGAPGRGSLRVAVLGALAAGLAVKVPALAGLHIEEEPGFYLRNASLFVLPILAAYFAWARQLSRPGRVLLAVVFAVAAGVANAYPVGDGAATEILMALHLPVVLWFAVGYAYVDGQWRSAQRRMDFVRFTGEWLVYYALLALGGGILVGLTLAAFSAIGVDVEWLVAGWILPCGALGAVVVAAWLVEAKQSVVENMAPVLTKVFTPLSAVMLLALLVTALWTGGVLDIDRDLLIVFDLLLVLVLGLLLYALSAREPQAPPSGFDRLQLVLLVAALAVDGLVLFAMVDRLSEFGLSPNRVTALGLNVVLLVNLARSALLSVGVVRRRRPVAALDEWQTGYLPVFPLWAAFVVVAVPPLFAFV